MMLQKLLLFSGLVALLSCEQRKGPDRLVENTQVKIEPKLDWRPPVAGNVIDKYERKITGTSLYNAFFRVSVITTDSSLQGHYIIKAEYGQNIHEIPYELPEWNDDRILKPMVKADTVAYGCLIGFNTGNGEFRPYFRIATQNKNGDMSIKQVATYRLSR